MMLPHCKPRARDSADKMTLHDFLSEHVDAWVSLQTKPLVIILDFCTGSECFWSECCASLNMNKSLHILKSLKNRKAVTLTHVSWLQISQILGKELFLQLIHPSSVLEMDNREP